jgi:hypothetical protein
VKAEAEVETRFVQQKALFVDDREQSTEATKEKEASDAVV